MHGAPLTRGGAPLFVLTAHKGLTFLQIRAALGVDEVRCLDSFKNLIELSGIVGPLRATSQHFCARTRVNAPSAPCQVAVPLARAGAIGTRAHRRTLPRTRFRCAR
eukprot:4544449-Pleurochrysis_carterae.AAC.1